MHACGERRPSSIHCDPPHVYGNESSRKIWIWIHIVNTELIDRDQLVYWQLRHSCRWNMALNGLVSLLRRCVLGWFLCTLSAPSGGVYTKWARKVLAPTLYQRQYWLEAWECLCGQSSLDSRQWASAQGTWLKAIIKHWEWNTSMQKKNVWPPPSLPTAYRRGLTGKSIYFSFHLSCHVVEWRQWLNVMFMDGFFRILVQACCSCNPVFFFIV